MAVFVALVLVLGLGLLLLLLCLPPPPPGPMASTPGPAAMSPTRRLAFIFRVFSRSLTTVSRWALMARRRWSFRLSWERPQHTTRG